MTDAETKPTPRPRRALRWLRDIGLFLLALLLVQWWQARPLAQGEAPPLAGIGLDGRAIDLQDARGSPVLVHFWGTWCPMCKVMQGSIASIAGDHRVITVALQPEGEAEVVRYMRERGLGFPTLVDTDGSIARRWGVAGVPASFVVDAAGQVSAATMGVSTGPGLRARLWLAGLGGQAAP